MHFKRLIITSVLLFVMHLAKSQQQQTAVLQGLHTREIYDLHVDKRGFLWVATNFGVSRYNGVDFTDFSNPHQASISATGLIEDKHGRIWFNNFSGQIFYIENEVMHLLKEFNYAKEVSFPRLALFNDDLVATSTKGLFVFNTNTMTGKYVSSSNSVFTQTTSVAALKNKAIAYGGHGNWFLYKEDGSLKNVKLSGQPEDFIDNNISTLHGFTKNDTALLISNPSGYVSKIIVRNDSLILIQKLHFDSFINTVTIEEKNNWVNTRAGSYSLSGAEPILNLNLTDVVTDRGGNNWYSSINKGLTVNYNKKSIINMLKIPSLKKNDLVISLNKFNNKLLLGTQNGNLLIYNYKTATVLKTIVFPPNSGSVNNVTFFDSSKFIAGCSANTYLVDVNTGRFTQPLKIRALKQIANCNNAVYVASSQGLYILPGSDFNGFKKEVVPYFKNILTYNEKNNLFQLSRRCRAVCYNTSSKLLFAAFKEGVYIINNKGIVPLTYNNENIYAASLMYANERVFIGTVNKGLLVLNGSGIRPVGVSEGLLSKTIFTIKLIDNRLWLMGDGLLQKYNLKTNKIENVYDLPSQEDAQIMDVEQVNNKIFVATFDGLFPLPANPIMAVSNSLPSYLLSVTINNTPRNLDAGHNLDFQHNNVQFKIGIPVYKYVKNIAIKYCLITEKDSIWHTSEPGERTITFSSLMPGNYQFVAFAIDPDHNEADSRISYNFFISPPWWQQWWFKIAAFLFVTFFMIYILKSYFLNKRKYQSILTAQQESIKYERQRISSEIHDDIGSGIFAIQLFADMASKARENVTEIAEISKMVKDISKKINEIIWSTNMENDNLENLLYYIQFQTTNLFEHSDIVFEATITDDIPAINISSQSRKNIYLVIKELVHNAIKHSKATKIVLDIGIVKGQLVIALKDNGVGFNPDKLKANSMGLANVKIRVEKLNGSIIIDSTNGTIININIPMLAGKLF